MQVNRKILAENVKGRGSGCFPEIENKIPHTY